MAMVACSTDSGHSPESAAMTFNAMESGAEVHREV